MELKKMIVKDDVSKAPYQFYAKMDNSSNNNNMLVNIVMPIGGSESALFRYPKAGEKVLVGIEGSDNYLMGYLPDTETTDNIYTNTNQQILPDEQAGQFFRYKGPKAPFEKPAGDNYYDKFFDTDYAQKPDRYSEIGFYHEKTLWNIDGIKLVDNNDFEGKPQDIAPEVDTLRIKSEGDILQKAKNHNQIKAKRFELLVNCDGSKYTDKESNEQFAMGDMAGDDPDLYAGDAHIRAKNRIVIKAEKEILLEVGRSAIIINEDGVRICSRRTGGNLESGWDSNILVCPGDGLFMYGKEIQLRAGLLYELSEGYGGKISSSLGIMRVEGLDIRLATLNSPTYTYQALVNGADLLLNLVTLITGAAGAGGSLETVPRHASKVLKAGGYAITHLLKKSDNIAAYDALDGQKLLVEYCDLIALGIFIIRMVVEEFVPEKLKNGKESWRRDIIYTVFALVEYGMYLAAVEILIHSTAFEGFFEGVVHIGKGQVVLDANKIIHNATKVEEQKSPLAGMPDSQVREKTEDGFFEKFWKTIKTNPWALGGVAMLASSVVAGVGVGIGVGITDAWIVDENYADELRKL